MNKKLLIGLIIFLLLVAVVLVIFFFVWPKATTPPRRKATQNAKSAEDSPWQVGQVAVGGNYADAEVIKMADDKYRLYYSIEPEVKGNKLEMYSALSSNGINWEQEAGIRNTFKTFPDLVKLADGSYRMYYQTAGEIKSSTSSDGLNWTEDVGVRVSGGNPEGLDLDNVAASTTILLPDQSYLMVYRGQIDKKYRGDVPNQSTQLFFWAESPDGLKFEKKGIAVDSRNDSLLGMIDGPELIKWDDGSIRLYFWGYKGVYYSTYKNGQFTDPTLTFTTSTDSKLMFPPNPPGDPTLAKIGQTWFMYYGQHEKGIFYTTLK
ncbi:MAG: hypothetical protein A2Z11_00010 [Candidatus Woykebacteria bacterium RBG_16_43_9]|uniref:Glycosyl hydrolase family 32 N-terminal domain-containing protein n=1 Tax=Candidatus Woykebacteria bacterium RBG_16_43_9 TaxID=1802596 RepID=A0A1G1WGR2_9BACT|nr:MAG: hypothetical protein A2Z11_00010 [Candidatus Woykebacteria bacterium RBG_16_43_9]